jgi:hypothetical protein
MANGQAAYELLIRELCESADIPDWEEIARTQHITIDGNLVALVNEVHSEQPTLSVHVTLGPTFPERDGELYARMLAANIDKAQDMPGHYGLHPTGRQAVYTLSLDIESLTGAQLAELLETQIVLAKRRMQELSQAN